MSKLVVGEIENAAGANPYSITLSAAQATTSGTSIDFTSIPAGTKRITVMYVGVSTSGSSDIIAQVGDGGGVETSGYLGCIGSIQASSAACEAYTDGCGVTRSHDAANIVHGQTVFELENSSAFTWTMTSCVSWSNSTIVNAASSSKSLSAELDRVRITTQGGSDTFDAGAMSVTFQ